MSLRFIIGRSRSGKSTLCLNEINEKQKQAKRLIYIVPEQYSLQAERELVAVTGGIMSAAVLSFRRLAENIFSEKGGAAGARTDDTGKLMILRKVLMDNADRLNYFGIVCRRQGFIERLASEISEFASGGITPENIREYAEDMPKDSPLAAKLTDIALIYEEYCKFIKDRYIVSDDILTIAAEKMNGADYIDGAEVWLDGFYGFTYQEYRIIEKLLASCRRVTVVLTMDRASAESSKLTCEDSFYEPWDTMCRLKKLCTDNGYRVEKNIYTGESFYSSEGMKRLEKEYFGWNINNEADSDGIKIMTAASSVDEINMCASEIISLVRDRGLRFRDIALTARNLTDYEETVRLVFSHYGIPFFMDTKRTVMGKPCTELVCAIAEMTACDLSFESVFRCLKTELTGITRDERDILENYVIRYGIKGSTWINERWQMGFENESDTAAEDRMNDIKERAITPFADFYKKFRSGKHSVRDITVGIFEILEKLEVADILGQRAEKEEAEGNSEKAQEQVRCYEMIGELMESMVSLLGDDEVDIKEYSEILEAGLAGLRMGIIPAGIDAVTVGDIERTRLPSVKALFVAGANEGVLPSVNTESGGIFTEREREALENAGAELAHCGARLAFEEQYLIYLGITKPEKYLYICRAASDSSGRETRPSPVIGRLENIFPKLEHAEFDDMSVKAVDRPIPTLHRLGKGIASGADHWLKAAEWLKSDEEYRNRAVMITDGISEDEANDKLGEENIGRLYGDKMYTSVSRLEAFAECPFYYFARYSLEAKPRKMFEIQTPDLGVLFHEVLKEVTEKMKENGQTWQTLTEEEAVLLTEEAIDRLAPDTASRVLLSTAAYKYLIKRVKRITSRAVTVLKKHMDSGKFEMLGSEISFGMGGLPAIEIEMPDGRKLMLRGKIDRVDIYRKEGNGYIKIIDYKSGSKDFSLSDVYYGLQLQLLLYMDAFLKTGKPLTIDEPQIGGVFYFRIMDPVVKASELKGSSPEAALYKKFCMTGLACDDKDVLEAFDDVLAYADKSDIISVGRKRGDAAGSAVGREEYKKLMDFTAERAAEIGEQIAQGNVSVSPAMNRGQIHCDYCEYKAMCCFEEDSCGSVRKLKRLTANEVWHRILSDNDR